MKTKTIFFGLLFLVINAFNASAQIEIGGTIDAEFRAAGGNSTFIDNNVPADFRHAHFNVAQLNLVGFAPISDQFFAETRMGFSSYGTGEIDQFKLFLASVTYAPNDKFSMSAGRFITPFGAYPDQQLVIDRTFIDQPINYTYFQNISSEIGLIGRKFRYNNSYGDSLKSLLNTVFYDGYNTGLRFDWRSQDSKKHISAALTNQGLSKYDIANIPGYGLTLRTKFMPTARFEWALSGSIGTYFEESEANASIQDEVDLETLTQISAGIYGKWQFTYLEIVSEAIYTQWESPVFRDTLFFASPTPFVRDGSGAPVLMDVENIGANIDFKYEPPSMSGTYFALRAESMYFFEADNPVTGDAYNWDKNFNRYTLAIARKFDRNVVGKLVFSDQDKFNLKMFTLRAYITAAF